MYHTNVDMPDDLTANSDVFITNRKQEVKQKIKIEPAWGHN